MEVSHQVQPRRRAANRMEGRTLAAAGQDLVEQRKGGKAGGVEWLACERWPGAAWKGR